MTKQFKDICFSGGAIGADAAFGKYAASEGHRVYHIGFEGMTYDSSVPPKTLFYLEQHELDRAREHLLNAAPFMKRRFPAKSQYVTNLLLRNFYQIKQADSIYAVSSINQETGIVNGGTGWAVTMGVFRGVPSIYCYDQDQAAWFKFKDIEDGKLTWKYMNYVPYPSGLYAGIGTRDLNVPGKEAIKELYYLEDINIRET